MQYAVSGQTRIKQCDKNGEIIFKITPEISKRIKPGAFYNFSVLANAFDLRTPTEYKKLTDNGLINIEYGAQDILVKPADEEKGYDNVESIRLEPVSDENVDSVISPYMSSRLVGMRLEEV